MKIEDDLTTEIDEIELYVETLGAYLKTFVYKYIDGTCEAVTPINPQVIGSPTITAGSTSDVEGLLRRHEGAVAIEVGIQIKKDNLKPKE